MMEAVNTEVDVNVMGHRNYPQQNHHGQKQGRGRSCISVWGSASGSVGGSAGGSVIGGSVAGSVFCSGAAEMMVTKAKMRRMAALIAMVVVQPTTCYS